MQNCMHAIVRKGEVKAGGGVEVGVFPPILGGDVGYFPKIFAPPKAARNVLGF
jgi:hypothetical protein